MREKLTRFFQLAPLDNRYPSLHGLRVFAILSVVQFHVTALLGVEGYKLDLRWIETSLGVWFGMDLFFVLSGFLIGSILLHSLESGGKLKSIGRFYLRRVFRTFPSYYVVLTFLALVRTLTPMQRAHLPYEYVYLTNFFSLRPHDVVMLWGWSLALEEQFYLVVPLLFIVLQKLATPRLQIALLVILWLGALVVRMTIWLRYTWTDNDLRTAIYFQTYTRYDTLVAGIFLAIVHKRYGAAISHWLTPPFHRAVVAMPTLLCLWLLMEPAVFGFDAIQGLHVFAWGTLTSLMYIGWLLLLLHGPTGFFESMLRRPIFRSIATLGYGVYLVHLPYCDVITPIAFELSKRHFSMAVIWPASFGAVMALSLATAYLLHLLIEKPALWVRDKLAS